MSNIPSKIPSKKEISSTPNKEETKAGKGFGKIVSQNEQGKASPGFASKPFKSLDEQGFKEVPIDSREKSMPSGKENIKNENARPLTGTSKAPTQASQQIESWVSDVKEFHSGKIPKMVTSTSISTNLENLKSNNISDSFHALLDLSEAFHTASSEDRLAIIKAMATMINDNRFTGHVSMGQLAAGALNLWTMYDGLENMTERQAWVDGVADAISNQEPKYSSPIAVPINNFTQKYESEIKNREIDISKLYSAVDDLYNKIPNTLTYVTDTKAVALPEKQQMQELRAALHSLMHT